jgi:adenylylsulfate kinase|tara:strand:+ start:3906 stop:4322 length:417 start_codon:yes stop_codon:yes gene_type:complete
MKKKILIMGLPGAGKTTLAKKLVSLTNAVWLNADDIRRKNNDWDFSNEGRLRQAKRMANLADKFKKDGNYVIADFVCPTPMSRQLFNPDFVIWMDTIEKGRFEDTNQMFVPPKKFNVRVTEKNSDLWSLKIVKLLEGM